MKNIQPIKRSKQLVPLSREHHDALLFIWKIKEGLKNKTTIPVIIEYINWFWTNHLEYHFADEEKVLLPYLAENDPLSQQLRAEHASIRELIIGARSEETIRLLIGLLDDHIRFEERILFPHIEKTVLTHQLDEIAQQLGTHAECVAGWKNEFWKK